MVARGYGRDFAERCFKQIEGFGTYGFPESHAASFALLVYASAWMKCRYPDVFACALLNAQPMGFYAPAQIVRDARDHGVAIRAVDINFSDWDHDLEPVGSAGRGAGPRIHPRHADDARRHPGRPCDPARACGRSRACARPTWTASSRGAGAATIPCATSGCAPSCRPAVLERLAEADAFRSLGLDRRDALWAVRGLNRAGRQGRPAAVRARGGRGPRARRRPAAACRSASMWSRTTATCPCR